MISEWSAEKIEALLSRKENERIEFKKAGGSFSYDETARYCRALANEGGGLLVLGVTPEIPRSVSGTSVFENLDEIKHRLLTDLHIRIDVEAPLYDGRRLVIFQAHSRPIGMPVHYKGAYWMRSGESLVPMSPDQLDRIFAETAPDFSAQVCPSAIYTDLSEEALRRFSALWSRKAGRPDIAGRNVNALLEDAELACNGAVTYAALILFGTRAALGKHCAQAELIFEYRSDEANIRYAQREEFREGFFLWYDRIWELINLRNDLQHYEEGLFVWDIPTFNETAIREVILNAISHRDYRLGGSTFVRQTPQSITITSPGGFPEGITTENIIERQSPRNRRIAEALARCGLIERSGQGMDSIFRTCLLEGKNTPDFTGTDSFQVSVRLDGAVTDQRFLRFLERINRESTYTLSLKDLLVIEAIRKEQPIEASLKERLPYLLQNGIIERAGRSSHILSRRFYSALGEKGTYTRIKGLDRDEKKALLLKHIRNNNKEGSTMAEFMQVLPALGRSQIQVYLRELKAEQKIMKKGITRAARWFPVIATEDA